MKKLILSSLGLLLLGGLGLAQSTSNPWEALHQFVESQRSVAIPNEAQILQSVRADAAREGQPVKNEADPLDGVRQSYWETFYLEEHREAFVEYKRLARKNQGSQRRATGPVDNPPLVRKCNLNIAVIVDRSASINTTEASNIQSGLTTFINNQVGLGNAVTFIGMSDSPSSPATVSPTVVYNAGVAATVHQQWIANLAFGGNRHSWGAGLTAAVGLSPDLVLIIADGASFNSAERTVACNAANLIKTNGVNGGTGGHIFVFGQNEPGEYNGNSLTTFLSFVVDDMPTPAGSSPNATDIANNDFIALPLGTFNNLGAWLGTLSPGQATVEVTSITNRNCVIDDVTISGTYTDCPPNVVVASIFLEFWQNGSFTGLSLPVMVNANGTWTVSSRRSILVSLGLNNGTWYDVRPRINLSSGNSILGDEFLVNTNNDIFLAKVSMPRVIVNDALNDRSTEMSRFCSGSPIFYHGFDPQSNDHFNAIQRKPIGDPRPYGEYRDVGFLGQSLDGFNGDLLALYPGYFQAGFEYRLSIAASNVPNCIGWSPTKVIFQVIDCCAPPAEISSVPECVRSGEEFTIEVRLKAPLRAEDIERIYSFNSDYTYQSHTSQREGNDLVLLLTFISNTCDCLGRILTLDIIIEGCPFPIWLMTDPLPCCAETCDFISVGEWGAGNCLFVDGQRGRPFQLIVSSPAAISAIFAESNSATCQVELVNLSVRPLFGTLYQVSGLMLFASSGCTGHALVSIRLQTAEGCCLVEQGFSFPEGCDLPELCLGTPPRPQVRNYFRDPAVLEVSIGLPPGSSLSITDLLTGATYAATVEGIECAPFLFNGDGSLDGVPCNGFRIPLPDGLVCRIEDGVSNVVNFQYEIRLGECRWIITGDYCQILAEIPIGPGPGGDEIPGGASEGLVDAQSETFQAHRAPATHQALRVYPNPIRNEAILQIDLSQLTSPVERMAITDLSGKLIELIPIPREVQSFPYQWPQSLRPGLYFITAQLSDGTTNSTRMVKLN
ncbi:MAG: T9SS type A sorting domain-containing protein [Bacteroidota bacterium]